MTTEVAIANLNNYHLSMQKSYMDKMFFVDKIDNSTKIVLDFGCADGFLTRYMAESFPTMIFWGYDKDEQSITKADSINILDNCHFTFNLETFNKWLIDNNYSKSEVAINLSSVIHEVYSYSTEQEIEEFWKYVNSGFKYIIIRDMCMDSTAHRPALKEDLIKFKSRFDNNKITEFEKFHGSIADNYNLIHLLLKHKYEENWAREVRENYVPKTAEELATKINNSYKLIYFDHYILPYVANTIKESFDITIKDYTHIKFIYKKD